MNRVLLVLAGFLAVSLPLTWLWLEGGRVLYGQFFREIAPPVYEALGLGDARIGAHRQRYINWIPFVALMLVTPGLALRRRAASLALGLPIFVVAHLALNLTESFDRAKRLPVLPSLLSDALPFVLWIAFAWPVVSRWFESFPERIPAANDAARERGTTEDPHAFPDQPEEKNPDDREIP